MFQLVDSGFELRFLLDARHLQLLKQPFPVQPFVHEVDFLDSEEFPFLHQRLLSKF